MCLKNDGLFTKDLLNYNAQEFLTSWNEDDLLGSGGYACVRKCQHPKLGEIVVKCFATCGSNVKQDKVFEEYRNVLACFA